MSLRQVLQIPGPKHMLDNITQSFLHRLSNFAMFADSGIGFEHVFILGIIFVVFPHQKTHKTSLTTFFSWIKEHYGRWISFSRHSQTIRSSSFRINYAVWSHCCTPMTTDAVWWIPGWVLIFNCVFSPMSCHIPILVPSPLLYSTKNCHWKIGKVSQFS